MYCQRSAGAGCSGADDQLLPYPQRLVRAVFRGKEQYIDSLNQYSLLIIDDLGIERSTEFALEQVFNVIDSRYRSKLPLIVTTNMTLEELKNPQDLTRSRIYDRVLERCVPLRINNQNIRQRNAAESMKEARRILAGGTEI